MTKKFFFNRIDFFYSNSTLFFFFFKHLKDVLEKLAIYDAVWILSKEETFYQVFFPCEGPGMECDFVLETIKERGIGEKGLSTVGYV